MLFTGLPILAIVSLPLTLGGAIPAPSTGAPSGVIVDDPMTIAGTIASVNDDLTTFVVEKSDESRTKLTTNSYTTYTLDGQESTAAEVLKTGMLVTATYEESLARSVSGTTEKPPR